MTVFQSQAVGGRETQGLGRLEVGLGMRFAAGLDVLGDQGGEAADQAARPKVPLDRGQAGRGGDGAGQARFGQVVEDFHHAGLQGDAGRHVFVGVGADGLRPRGEVEPLAEVFHHDLVAGRILQADHPLEGGEGQLAADSRGGMLHGAEDHRLGVDQQAIHVENDGANGAGEVHGAD